MWIRLTKAWNRGDRKFKRGQIVEMDDGSGKRFIADGRGFKVDKILNANFVEEQEGKEFLRAEPTNASRKARTRKKKKENENKED